MNSSVEIRRRYVCVDNRHVHYRVAGQGPPVVLLHDSPRSSVIHVPLLRALADEFTLIALDTPGYGFSDPLPIAPVPDISAFAEALTAALRALGVTPIVLYAFHTSSKIAIEAARREPHLFSRLVIDGISLPVTPTSESFIGAYMRPFAIDDTGAYIAREWTRARDLHRFFPWFERRTTARLEIDEPSPELMHAYVMDLFRAGPHFSSAYAAAMRYAALPALQALTCPTTFLSRTDDVLYSSLDVVDRHKPASALVERLSPDTTDWLHRLRRWFREGVRTADAAAWRLPHNRPKALGIDFQRSMIDTPSGQLHMRARGLTTDADAIVLLHDLPGSAHELQRLAGELAVRRPVLLPDLPGCGQSDPLRGELSVERLSQDLASAFDTLGLSRVHLFGRGVSARLVVGIAEVLGERIASIALELMPPCLPRELVDRYCTPIALTRDGSHFLDAWHRCRDQQLQWPWFDGRCSARNAGPYDLSAENLNAGMLTGLEQPATWLQMARLALGCDRSPTPQGRSRHRVLILEPGAHSSKASADEPADAVRRARSESIRDLAGVLEEHCAGCLTTP